MGQVENGHQSLADFAEILGVAKQRIHRLKQEGRLPEVEQADDGSFVLPHNPRVYRRGRTRPGPVTDYIRVWEQANGVKPEDNVLAGVK
jgi:hypothetical protein